MEPYYRDDHVTLFHGDAEDVLPRLEQAGVSFFTGKKLVSISQTEIVLEDTSDSKQEAIQADLVVLSVGVRPVNDLYEKLQGLYPNLYVIGDAQKVGRIAQATRGAYNVAMSL